MQTILNQSFRVKKICLNRRGACRGVSKIFTVCDRDCVAFRDAGLRGPISRSCRRRSSLLPLTTKAAPVPDVDSGYRSRSPPGRPIFAARYWFGEGKTGKSLYGVPSISGTQWVSRLTYSGLIMNSGELVRTHSGHQWLVPLKVLFWPRRDLERVATGRGFSDADFRTLFEHDKRAAQRLSDLCPL